MSQTARRLPPHWLLHSPVRPAARALFKWRWDITVSGEMPASGPVILAANHIGVIDGPMLAVLAARPVHALAKKEMFDGKVGPILRQSGQIRLDRFNPDRGAIRQALAYLDAGRVVGIFPEGTRGNGELERIKNGAAYLAMVTGAPIVPVAFFGTRLPGAKSSALPPKGAAITMALGSPLVLDQVKWPRTRDNVGIASQRVHSHLQAHLKATQALTGLTLPGPLPASEDEE